METKDLFVLRVLVCDRTDERVIRFPAFTEQKKQDGQAFGATSAAVAPSLVAAADRSRLELRESVDPYVALGMRTHCFVPAWAWIARLPLEFACEHEGHHARSRHTRRRLAELLDRRHIAIQDDEASLIKSFFEDERRPVPQKFDRSFQRLNRAGLDRRV